MILYLISILVALIATLFILKMIKSYMTYLERIKEAKKNGYPIVFTQFITLNLPYLPKLAGGVTRNTLSDTLHDAHERLGKSVLSFVDHTSYWISVNDSESVKFLVSQRNVIQKPVKLYSNFFI